MSKLKKEIILVLISGCLLVSLLFYMTYAWYTKVVSVQNMDFVVAEWDFNANHGNGKIAVNVYDYLNVKETKVAPGTEGCIPVQLCVSAAAQTDVVYALQIDTSGMDDRFKQRIHFYYYKSDADNGFQYTAASNPTKVEFDDDNYINGTLHVISGLNGTPETEKIVYVYWRWFYDYEEYVCYTYDIENSFYEELLECETQSDRDQKINDSELDSISKNELITLFLNLEENEKEYDDFDMAAAKNSDLYSTLMAATLNIMGAEATPIPKS